MTKIHASNSNSIESMTKLHATNWKTLFGDLQIDKVLVVLLQKSCVCDKHIHHTVKIHLAI